MLSVIALGLSGKIGVFCLSTLLTALILWTSIRWVIHVNVLFWSVLLTALLVIFASYAVQLAVSILIAMVIRRDPGALGLLGTMPAAFLAQAAVIRLRLKTTYGDACLIVLAFLAIVTVMAAIVATVGLFLPRFHP